MTSKPTPETNKEDLDIIIFQTKEALDQIHKILSEILDEVFEQQGSEIEDAMDTLLDSISEIDEII